MKKRLIAHVMILMMTLSMLSGIFLSAGASVGSVTHVREMTTGSPKGTYYVENEADLSHLATLVNDGMSMTGYTFLQTADITLTSANFTPIGLYKESKPFRGNYDGQRHTISNLQIYDENLDGAGLFGYAYHATLKNIGIESGSVTSANRPGGVAGYADGCTVINCYNKADITMLTGTDGAGGIAGVARAQARIYGCYNAGTITCASIGVSGIIGWAGKNENSMLIGCYSAGTLKHTETLGSTRPLDVVARTTRTIGDFSSCYYLAGIYGTETDNYNLHNAQKLEAKDNVKMAYVLNHATGVNTNAFTVDKNGELVFSSDETQGVADLRIKAMRGGVLLEDTGINRVTAGGYTVPSTYASYKVLNATVGDTSYKVGAFIPADTADVLTVTLNLEGSYPSVADYDANTDSDVFTVATAAELAKLGEMVDTGNTFAGKTIYVTADLDFSDYPTWDGIGYAAGSGGGVVAEGSLPFSGTFDGQFHHFKNIDIKGTSRYTAIFSHTEGATLKNIIFDKGTIHLSSKTGRCAGVLIGLMSNTTVMNMENHVSVYSDQVAYDADNMGFVAMSTNASVIKNVVSYGEIGLQDKTEITQQNGGLIGWGYGKTSVDNCIVVGAVAGSTYHPIARGATITNSYYLPHGEIDGTMTYKGLLSGNASWVLNQTAGTNLWSKAEYGPALNPDFPVSRVQYTLYDVDATLAGTDPLVSGVVTEFNVVGEQVSLPAQSGYTSINEAYSLWPLTNTYTMPCFEQMIPVWYSHNTYNINYVTNGGVFTTDPTVTALSGLSQELPGEGMLERSGYFFTGWYDNQALSGEPVTVTPLDIYHDVTYYAGWEEATKISTAKQLASMDLNGNYILTADIDLTGVSFGPIGSYETPFTGHFDGDGHVISGLNIKSTEDYQGLFAVNAGTIRNLILAEDCFVSGDSYVGGIAGDNVGTIENCISRATVSSAVSGTPTSFSLLVQNMRVASPIPAVRQNAMKERMDTYDPDLMLLQEANSYWITFLNNNYVNTGEYKMLYKYRAESSTESVPVLYKPDKFTLVDSGHFWLSTTPTVESKPADAKHYRICTWAMLKERSTQRYIAVFSVHFDNSNHDVRSINAQALKNQMDAIRLEYKAYDPMVIVAGDFNARRGTNPYNIMATGDMVDASYEITTGVAKPRIDHVLISENNIKAVDETFEHLPVIDADREIPSDHEGIYVEMEELMDNRHGVIAGHSSGAVRYSVAEGSVSDGVDHGALIGQNLGETDTLFYADSGVEPFGLTVETNDATVISTPAATAYTLSKQVVVDRFTLTNGSVDLIQYGEEPACLTESGAVENHQYGKSKTVAATCTEAGYTIKTCSVCGYQSRTVGESAKGHQYGALATFDELYHQQACTVCGDILYNEHSFTESLVTASCDSYGAVRYTCACGEGYDVMNDDAKNHIWGGCVPNDHTTHLQTCVRDTSHTLQRAHTFKVTSVDATCETEGSNTYACSDCSYNYSEVVGEPLGHQYGKWAELDGESHQAVCEHDNSHVITAPHQLKAEFTVAPTCETEGYTHYVCTDCGYGYDGDIQAALGHAYTYDAEAKAYVCHCTAVYVPEGDLNGDGAANTGDAILVLRRVCGRKDEIPDYAADLNCDGLIKIYDAVLFLQMLNK